MAVIRDISVSDRIPPVERPPCLLDYKLEGYIYVHFFSTKSTQNPDEP